MHRRLQTLVAVGCALIASAFFGVVPADASAAGAELGLYRGPANPNGVAEFGTWLGRRPTVAVDFLADDTWEHIASPVWWADRWAGSPYRMVYSVPLIPDSGGSLQAGAGGAYNVHFRRLAETLVGRRQGNAILRLGWEFNLPNHRWTAEDDPGAFAEYWRQIVRTIRAVPGAEFQFDWCPNVGTQAVAPERAYPGDAYVDYIGMDAYDVGWGENWTDPVWRWNWLLTQQHGLHWHRSFAAAHGKPMSYPEWGLWIRPDGHGGGDNPYYIERMSEWFASVNLAYQSYFEASPIWDGQHELLGPYFPRGAAAYRARFGPASEPAPSASAPTPPPALAPSPQPAAPPARPSQKPKKPRPRDHRLLLRIRSVVWAKSGRGRGRMTMTGTIRVRGATARPGVRSARTLRLVWRSRAGWRLLAHTTVRRSGHFTVRRTIRRKARLHIRAVARVGARPARSRVVRLRLR